MTTTLKDLAMYAARSDFDLEQEGGDWKQSSDWRDFVRLQVQQTMTEAEWHRFKLDYQLERAQLAGKKFGSSHPAFY